MKRIPIIISVICLSTLLAACGNSIANKAVEESKMLMASKDYEAALNYLELAKNEGNTNTDVDTMIEIIDNYLEAKKQLEAANIDGSNVAMDAIPKSYTQYTISRDIDDLREAINKKQAVMADIDSQISGTKKMIADGDYVSAEANITELYSKDMTGYQEKQVDEMNATVKSAQTKISEAENKAPDVVYVPQNPPAPPNSGTGSRNSYSSIISNRSTSEIENYITSYVRPLYNKVQANLNSYSSSSSNGIIYWRDGKGYIKKQFNSGVNGYNMSREYFYDTDSGRIAFAFVYSGIKEYRLYFRTNQLVRYIGPDGVTINNPTSSEALSMASQVLSEAY